MFLENFINHLKFDLKLEKSAKVKLRMYDCGSEFEVDLHTNMLTTDGNGNLVIIADDN